MTGVGASQLSLMGDGFRALGFGFALSFCYHVFRLALPVRNAAVNTALHAVFFAFSGVFFFCYILGETASEAPRWFMFAALALAAWIYASTAAKWVAAAAKAARRALSFILSPIASAARRVRNILQSLYRLLYNRVAKSCAARAARRRKRNEPERTQRTKEPIKVYTQT